MRLPTAWTGSKRLDDDDYPSRLLACRTGIWNEGAGDFIRPELARPYVTVDQDQGKPDNLIALPGSPAGRLHLVGSAAASPP